MKFSDNLIKLRKKEGLSQEDLANELDVSRQTVSKWELGVTTPEMEKLVQIAKFFDVKVDDLVSDETEAEKKEKTTINKTENNTEQKKSRNAGIKIVVASLIIIPTTIIIICVVVAAKLFTGKKNENNMSSSDKFEKYVENRLLENNDSAYEKKRNEFYESMKQSEEAFNEKYNKIKEKINNGTNP